MNRHCAPCVLARSSALAVQLATICSDFQMAAFVTVDWSMRNEASCRHDSRQIRMSAALAI